MSQDRTTRPDLMTVLRRAARQEQFLEVVDSDEAEARFHGHLALRPLGEDSVPLANALGRVLARDTLAPVDVPGFDRASVDGFALRAADTVGASEEKPRVLRVNAELLTPGIAPKLIVQEGTATVIATGGMLPRGADAVVMVEHTDAREDGEHLMVEVRRATSPGQFVAAAGSDIARGETVLCAGRVLTSREIGMLAAVGLGEIPVWRRPAVAVFSTGDEIVVPGGPIRPGQVYDSNAAMLTTMITESGGDPVPFGIVPDDEAALADVLDRALAAADMVVLSGGTSKGAGDLAYRVVSRLENPGVVVHGVALKPGKPLCLAVTEGKAVVILPGFPTSAVFTFHEFVAPVIRALAGQPPHRHEVVPAIVPLHTPSERGRREYVMASLVRRDDARLAAYPTTKGSGSVTAFAQADGFFAIDSLTEAVPAGTPVEVRLISTGIEPADLVVIGSHCVGLDLLISRLVREGITVKALNVGSMGGLAAARRGECDIAGIHLMDPESGEYNRPFLAEALALVTGYARLQGIVFRAGDRRFEGLRSADEAIAAALRDPDCLMINRNAGSGTRILIDRLLGGARPGGYWMQAKSHNAVAVAVAQHRVDWGLAIENVAQIYGLGFIAVQPERYDFVIPRARLERRPVQQFIKLLENFETRKALAALGFKP